MIEHEKEREVAWYIVIAYCTVQLIPSIRLDLCMYICIYICVLRRMERDREKEKNKMSICARCKLHKDGEPKRVRGKTFVLLIKCIRGLPKRDIAYVTTKGKIMVQSRNRRMARYIESSRQKYT